MGLADLSIHKLISSDTKLECEKDGISADEKASLIKQNSS